MAAETDLRLVPCEPLLALRALYEAVGICAGVGVLHVTVSWSCSIIKAVVRFFCRLGSAVGCWHVDIGLGLRSCAGLLYYWIRSELQAIICDRPPRQSGQMPQVHLGFGRQNRVGRGHAGASVRANRLIQGISGPCTGPRGCPPGLSSVRPMTAPTMRSTPSPG